MSRFPTPAHLASWAKFAPGVKESAGRNKGNGSTGHGDPYLAPGPGRGCRRREPDRHLPRRALPTHRPPPRQEEGDRRGQVPSWSSSGTCCPTPTPTSTTSARTSTTSAADPNGSSRPMSANSKPSATRSPSNPPLPDRLHVHKPFPAPPGAVACPLTLIFPLAGAQLPERSALLRRSF